MRSFSRQGYGGITLWMKGGSSKEELDKAWYQVRKKIGDVRQELPEGVRGPFFNDEFGDTFGNLYAITGDGFGYPELRTFADAARNEFRVDGKLLIGYGGSESLQSPIQNFGPATKQLMSLLGVDIGKFETTYFHHSTYADLGLSRGTFFSAQRFGEDRLVTGDPTAYYPPGYPWFLGIVTWLSSPFTDEPWLAAGLLQAAAKVYTRREPVLLCAYDATFPPPLDAVRSTSLPFAAAMMLTPDPEAYSEAQITVRFAGGACNEALAAPCLASLQPLRQANAAAHVLRLLEVVASALPTTRVFVPS